MEPITLTHNGKFSEIDNLKYLKFSKIKQSENFPSYSMV